MLTEELSPSNIEISNLVSKGIGDGIMEVGLGPWARWDSIGSPGVAYGITQNRFKSISKVEEHLGKHSKDFIGIPVTSVLLVTIVAFPTLDLILYALVSSDA
ncbi:hypothetical protein SUNI508_04669 [Seiridium unicorne]|uniref:Uncharacterized protein n=1 Tax=Seiridium unicorne TaxID=138068 RepID=A0ABR2V7V6_9PEZI